MKTSVSPKKSIHAVAVVFIGLALLNGCLSVHYLKSDKTPVVMGFGAAEPLEGTGGKIFRVFTPGLSLHLTPLDTGISFGWRETLYFFEGSGEGKNNEEKTSAAQIKTYGVDCSNGAISIGYSRTFFIPSVGPEDPIIQFLYYSEQNPEKTIVIRKEAL